MHGLLGRRNARHVIDNLGCDVIRSSAKCRRAERRVVQPLLGQPKVAQLHAPRHERSVCGVSTRASVLHNKFQRVWAKPCVRFSVDENRERETRENKINARKKKGGGEEKNNGGSRKKPALDRRERYRCTHREGIERITRMKVLDVRSRDGDMKRCLT